MTLTAPASFIVARKLETEGLAGYESAALACFLAALTFAGEGAVLDIGANVGPYCFLASALSERVVWAFEPMPEHVKVLEKIATENDLGFGIERLALGATRGQSTFYVSDVSDSSNSLLRGFRKSSRQIQVAVETLDRWCGRRKVVPAVLKVDTEATEPDVIAGGLQTIAQHRPWILCEVLAGRSEARLMEQLDSLKYLWFHPTGEPPYVPVREIKGDPTYKNMMWLFAPKEPTSEFWVQAREWAFSLGRCGPASPT